MQFTFNEEQDQLRATAQKFFADKSPTAEVRRLMETQQGYDPIVWTQLSSELGFTATHIPEVYGGLGLSYTELGILFEEMGRTLFCAPFLATAVAATAIMNVATESEKSELLPDIATGTRIATLAVFETSGQWGSDSIKLSAKNARLNGTKRYVLDGHIADLVIVVARINHTSGADTIGFFLVDGDAPGLTRRTVTTIDSTRKLTQLEFVDVSARRLGGNHDQEAQLAATLDLAAIGLANEMVGGAQHLVDETVKYAAERIQFGRAIGSFQAIKHKCADMLLNVEMAKSAAYYASMAAASSDPELPVLANLAKASASEAYMRIAAECIQIHGGIGFTWDNDTHLWFKRAKSSEVFFGDPSYHKEQLVARWHH